MPASKEAAAPRKRSFTDEDLRFTLHDTKWRDDLVIVGSLHGYPAYRKSLTRGGGVPCAPGLGGKCVICGTGDCTQNSGD